MTDAGEPDDWGAGDGRHVSVVPVPQGQVVDAQVSVVVFNSNRHIVSGMPLDNINKWSTRGDSAKLSMRGPSMPVKA